MEILIIFGLILLNGVFAMAEIALVSARKARLEAQANKGDAKAKEALQLSNHPDKFISTVQIGITLIGILNGIFSGESLKANLVNFLKQFEFIGHYSNSAATIIIVIIITYFSLVLGELVPKRIGLSNPESIAKTLAAPMRIVTYITYPFIWLLSISSNFIIKLFNIRRKDTGVTEDEIKAIISEGTEQGTIEEAEQKIIERVFHLGDRNITSLMTHRSDIVWLDINSKIEEIKQFTEDEVHSVYPVCDGNVDNVKGVVSLKDVFSMPKETPIKDVMRHAFYVPENNSAYQLLEKFKQQKTHYAFIVDEYGTLQGIITLNDILEAIVGDISEEHEEDYEIIKRDDGTYLIDAQIPYYDFLSYFNKTFWMDEGEQEEFDTLAGFILHHLERIPVTGDKMDFRGFTFEIMDMDGHRIDKLLVTLSDEVKEELKTE
jgi:putative hemolysin